MKTAEEILKKLTPKYSSFPAFLENEHSVDVYDVVIEAMEEYASQLKPDAKEFGKITEKNLKDAIRRIKQDKSKDERLREIIENSLYRF